MDKPLTDLDEDELDDEIDDDEKGSEKEFRFVNLNDLERPFFFFGVDLFSSTVVFDVSTFLVEK
jgi:hypothetical protein